MGEQAISEIVGRHDGAGAAAETATEASTAEIKQPADAAAATASTETAESTDPIAGLKSALGKERERASRFEKDFKKSERARQQEAAALRRELEALRASAPKPDPKASEEAFWSSSPPEFIDQRLSAFQQQQQAAATQERVEISKELAKDRYEDFDDVEAAFLDAAAKDQSLWNGVLDKKLPALEVYKRGKQLLAGAETAPDARIAKLEAMIAEMKAGRDGGQTSADAETADAPVKKPSIPKSNVGVRGSGVGKSTSWAGPTDIENVFGRRRAAR